MNGGELPPACIRQQQGVEINALNLPPVPKFLPPLRSPALRPAVWCVTQGEPFPLLLEPQANAAEWDDDALATLAGRASDATFQQAAAAVLQEARQASAACVRACVHACMRRAAQQFSCRSCTR